MTPEQLEETAKALFRRRNSWGPDEVIKLAKRFAASQVERIEIQDSDIDENGITYYFYPHSLSEVEEQKRIILQELV